MRWRREKVQRFKLLRRRDEKVSQDVSDTQKHQVTRHACPSHSAVGNQIMKVKTMMIGSALVVAIAVLAGCSGPSASDLQVGGLYSVVSSDDDFGVVKILILEEDTIRIRLYKNRFQDRPQTLDLKTLALGPMHEGKGRFTMSHLPVRRSEFLAWKPQLVMQTEVTEDELNGSMRWQQAGRGALGK